MLWYLNEEMLLIIAAGALGQRRKFSLYNIGERRRRLLWERNGVDDFNPTAHLLLLPLPTHGGFELDLG